jgi:hypothetical protein
MNAPRIRRPSPAFVVAMIALFVALGGTAGAVATQAVPLAKRALMAENAKKLGGQTSAQLTSKAVQQAVQQASAAPGPASTAAGLVVIKTVAAGQVAPGTSLRTFAATCDAGSKVVGGGMSSDGALATFDSYPTGDTGWEVVVGNLGSGAANASVYAVCIK